jgi:hypothetical protein
VVVWKLVFLRELLMGIQRISRPLATSISIDACNAGEVNVAMNTWRTSCSATVGDSAPEYGRAAVVRSCCCTGC